jgi:hypothetical protein
MAASLSPSSSPSARSWRCPPLLVLTALSSCNLFQSAQIEKTCDDFAQGCEGADTGSDTEGTEPSPGHAILENSSIGTVLFAEGGEQDLSLRARPSLPEGSDPEGPVAFDPGTLTFWFFDSGTGHVHWLPPGGPERLEAPQAPVLGMEAFDEGLLIAAGTRFLIWREGADAIEDHSSGYTFTRLSAVFPSSRSDFFLIDQGDASHSAVLYQFSAATGTVVQYVAGFFTSTTRELLQDAFAGASYEPMICSAAGAFYRLGALQEGDLVPEVVPSLDAVREVTGNPEAGVLRDVVDCGWDAEAGNYLFVSRSLGLFSLFDDGGLERHDVPEEGGGFVRAAFFP